MHVTSPRRLLLLALGCTVCVQYAIPQRSAAQRPLETLSPLRPDSVVNFGIGVDLVDDYVFVQTYRDWSAGESQPSSILVYRRLGYEWELTQRLLPRLDEHPSGFRTFSVTGNWLAARANDDVFLFRREHDEWVPAGWLSRELGSYESVIDMTEDHLLVRYKPTTSDGESAVGIFGRDRDSWTNVGILPDDRSCISGDRIIQLREVPAHSLYGGGISVVAADALVATTLTGSVWATSDTLLVRHGTSAHMSCGDSEVALHKRNYRGAAHAVLVASLDSTGQFSAMDEVASDDRMTGVMDIAIHDGLLYIGQEESVELANGRGVFLSEILVYSNRLGSWEYIRSVAPPGTIDPDWEPNDGCIGYDLKVSGSYLVAGAPFRAKRVGSDEYYYEVGDAFVFSTAGMDRRRPPEPEPPRFDLSWSNVYPNPGRGLTTVEYTLPADAGVDASVYDALGRRVAVLAEGIKPTGENVVSFDTANWAAGIYFVRMVVSNGAATDQTFVVLR